MFILTANSNLSLMSQTSNQVTVLQANELADRLKLTRGTIRVDYTLISCSGFVIQTLIIMFHPTNLVINLTNHSNGFK